MPSWKKLVWIFVIAWIALKIIMAKMVPLETNLAIGVCVNILFILLLAVAGARSKMKDKYKQDLDAMECIQASIRPALIYSLLATISIGLYYHVISKEEVQSKIEERMELVKQDVPNETTFEEFKSTDPRLYGISYDEYLENEKVNAEFIFSPTVHVTFALIALVLASILYGIMVSLIWRTFMTHQRIES